MTAERKAQLLEQWGNADELVLAPHAFLGRAFVSKAISDLAVALIG
jgi:hypothetical protein